MKFIITAVSMDSTTRQSRRITSEMIDTETNKIFKGCFLPYHIEEAFETFWSISPSEIVKVIDIKKVE